jgi:hypothetical protein
MRSKFILPEDEIRTLAEAQLRAPSAVPDGTDLSGDGLRPERFSQAMEARLVSFFENDLAEAWTRAEPVAIGSWGEGSSARDRILIFCLWATKRPRVR